MSDTVAVRGCCFGTAALLVFGILACAETSSESIHGASTHLDEIVITARKQTEWILKVPVAASTISAADLSRTATADNTSLGGKMTSVNFDNSSAGGGSIGIRGVGSSVIDSGVEQTVATVLGGVQTARGVFVNLGLLDLAQVEVLKGPQALFFGKNSPAGVLVRTSHAPTDKLDGFIKACNEFKANERIVEGVISGPITDTLRARVAARYSHLGGWNENVAVSLPNPFGAIPDVPPTVEPAPFSRNNGSNLIGRITVDYKPTANLTATVRVLGSRERDNSPSSTNEVSNCGGAANPDMFGIPDAAGDCGINNRVTVGATPPQVVRSNSQYTPGPYGRFDSYLPSLALEYSAGPVQFTSVTGYLAYDWNRYQINPT